jgi:hypothetical protein
MFEATRAGFVTEIAQDWHRVPLLSSAQARALLALVRRDEALQLAAQLLKQAADEMDGAYTNNREVINKCGAFGPAVVVYLPDNGRAQSPSASGGPPADPAMDMKPGAYSRGVHGLEA